MAGARTGGSQAGFEGFVEKDREFVFVVRGWKGDKEGREGDTKVIFEDRKGRNGKRRKKKKNKSRNGKNSGVE